MRPAHPHDEARAAYRPQSPDTAEWADRLLFRHWASLQPWEKAAVVTDLCRAAHELSLRGLAARHPDAAAEELELRAACLRIGRDAVERVLGHRLPFAD